MAVVIKTTWKVPELWFGRDRYPVQEDGTVVGLSIERKHFQAMVRIFDLTIEESSAEADVIVEEGDNG